MTLGGEIGVYRKGRHRRPRFKRHGHSWTLVSSQLSEIGGQTCRRFETANPCPETMGWLFVEHIRRSGRRAGRIREHPMMMILISRG
jgi:hypothetical protein